MDSTEISAKIRAAIKAKLEELGAYADEELPDYIMVMVANKKTKDQMTEDLNLFLGKNAQTFTKWLHEVLERLQSLSKTGGAKTTKMVDKSVKKVSKKTEKEKPVKAAAKSTKKSSKEPSTSKEANSGSKKTSGKATEKKSEKKASPVPKDENKRPATEKPAPKKPTKSHSPEIKSHAQEEEAEEAEPDSVDVLMAREMEKGVAPMPNKLKKSEGGKSSGAVEEKGRKPVRGPSPKRRAGSREHRRSRSPRPSRRRSLTPERRRPRSSSRSRARKGSEERDSRNGTSTRKEVSKRRERSSSGETIPRKIPSQVVHRPVIHDLEYDPLHPALESGMNSVVKVSQRKYPTGIQPKAGMFLRAVQDAERTFKKTEATQRKRNRSRSPEEFLDEGEDIYVGGAYSAVEGHTSSAKKVRKTETAIPQPAKPIKLKRAPIKTRLGGVFAENAKELLIVAQSSSSGPKKSAMRKQADVRRVQLKEATPEPEEEEEEEAEEMEEPEEIEEEVEEVEEEEGPEPITVDTDETESDVKKEPVTPSPPQKKKIVVRKTKPVQRVQRVEVNSGPSRAAVDAAIAAPLMLRTEIDPMEDAFVLDVTKESSEGPKTKFLVTMEGVDDEFRSRVEEKGMLDSTVEDSSATDGSSFANTTADSTLTSSSQRTTASTSSSDNSKKGVLRSRVSRVPIQAPSNQQSQTVNFANGSQPAPQQYPAVVSSYYPPRPQLFPPVVPPFNPSVPPPIFNPSVPPPGFGMVAQPYVFPRPAAPAPIIVTDTIVMDDEDNANDNMVSGSFQISRQGDRKPKERCRFWPECANGDECEFHHPSKPCTKFPACTFGESCLFIHPDCKFGVKCTRKDCAFTHSARKNGRTHHSTQGTQVTRRVPSTSTHYSTSTSPQRKIPSGLRTVPNATINCKFGSSCKNSACGFKHIPECKYGAICTRSDCRFTHPPNRGNPDAALESFEGRVETGGKSKGKYRWVKSNTITIEGDE